MGKKLDALLGRRGFKTSKLKTLLGLTVSRLGLLKNKCQARCSHTEGDIANLLQHGHHNQALCRAAYVVKERNMMDSFVLVERFCNVVRERAILLEHSKTCPAELEEAISSLIYMATRSGEMPELKDIRDIFSARYGETFVRSAMEVRNGCSVSPTIIQKMSTREPSHDDKMKIIKEIAAEKEIPLNLDDFTSPDNSSKAAKEELHKRDLREPVPKDSETPPHTWYWEEDLSGSGKMREKFKDASSAAEAAFKSAAFAAAAARVAVDLSREGSQGRGPDDQSSSNSPGPLRRPSKLEETPTRANQLGFEKIHPAQSDTTSESQDEDLVQLGAIKESEELRREAKPRPGKEIIYDSSDDEAEEVIQLEHRRSRAAANNRDGTRHDPQRNMQYDDDTSSSEEEEIPRRNEESKPTAPPYQRPPSLKTKEYAPDLMSEETSPSRDNNFRFAEGMPRRPPSKFADPRLKWGQPQSPVGQNYSFSVRTRRGGLQ